MIARTHESSPEERLRLFREALTQDGCRMTHQRLELLNELAKAEDHPDADQLFTRVRERVPTISRDTVYRTLGTLSDLGLIRRIASEGATRFDPDTTTHHHFMCERCGVVVDLDGAVVGQIAVPEAIAGIGAVRSSALHLLGVCEACEPGRV